VTPPVDGSADSGPSTEAGTLTDAGGTDAATPGDDTGTPPTGCGSGVLDFAGIPRTCRNDAECYDHPACVAAHLEAADRRDYIECGDPVIFTSADSDATCALGPPFGDWSTEFMCGRAAFEATVRFFCSPDGSTVLLRFSGTVRAVSPGEHYTYYGHDYYSGSGGGSGYVFNLSTPLEELSGDRFVGLQPIERTSDDAGGWRPFSVTVWFITGGLIDMSYFIGGGFEVSYSGP
jgi:hypothetical protein